MPTPPKGPRLGGGPAHERLILAGLATSLFEHKRITTTVTKAKRLRPYAERLITFGKRGDLHARRRVMRVIRDKSVVHTLFTEIAPLMADRPGGYTRITKIGQRQGDGAPMAVIELVLEPVQFKKKRPAVDAADAAASVDQDATVDEVTSVESDDVAAAKTDDVTELPEADAGGEATSEATEDTKGKSKAKKK